jgi:aerobic carbon-monoxide dehydrogenase small subunit
MRIAFQVNDRSVVMDAPADRRLIDILRHDLGVVGPKNSCAVGRCGACLVLVEDRPVNACLVLAARLAGRRVVTIEGLGAASEPVKDAMARAGAVQCGYCASGLVTMLTWLVAHEPHLAPAEAEALLVGQICRCTGYGGLRRALARLFSPRAHQRDLQPAATNSDTVSIDE